jgi:hypothetical protein
MAKNKKRMRWGFKWPQVGGGLILLLVGGGVAIAGWLAGRFVVWGFVAATIGFFTMLSGLIGEEGVW